jgi:cobaltochelatase CobT
MPSRDVLNVRFDAATQDFQRRFQHERLEILESSLPLVRALVAHYPQADREKIVVTFLIDHSMAMRGLKMLSALVAVECAISVLDQCNIRSEILGFTTRGTDGGQSRKKWRKARSPAYPGRLCDLRHIIYKTADQSTGWQRNLVFALHPEVPGDNIDGEAMEWAVSRLEKGDWQKRAVCFLSNAAPFDGSALTENVDPQLFRNHLALAEEAAQRSGVDVGYLLLSSEAREHGFRFSEIGIEPESAGKGLLRLIESMILQAEPLTSR